ncbi:MAG: hypothetical protein ACREN6_16000 [Gemmatimonadaceae bacterium]
MNTGMVMDMTGPLGISMNRMGSGTSWVPDAVSEPTAEFQAGSWDLMVHGLIDAQYDQQGGPRGASQLGSLSWGMLMATHGLAGGQLQLRAMLSVDAAGVTNHGYPLLLQSGETWHGQPLFDRQHPHDFFMEVAALHDREIARNLGLELYLAPAGEPALGPVAYMHRMSAMDDPAAPIGHHWQDASHVSFGVATVGLFTRRWKVEGSVFNGHDPDENRWNFDFHPLDSYSGRATFNPDSAWSVSASFGFLRDPETANPAHTTHRTVVSLQNGRMLGSEAQLSTSLIWGMVTHSDQHTPSQSVLAESEWGIDARNAVFGRAEFVQKTADDLVLPEGPTGFPPTRLFPVGDLSLGYVRELVTVHRATIGLGVMGTVNVVPAVLVPFYGSRTPLGAIVYLRLRAIRAAVNPMGAMEGMTDGACLSCGPRN